MKWPLIFHRIVKPNARLVLHGDDNEQVASEVNGFVLADAVVALTIGALAIGGAMIALRQGQLLHVETLKRTQALVLCEEQLRQAIVGPNGPGVTKGDSPETGLSWVTTISPVTQTIILGGQVYLPPGQSLGPTNARAPLLQIKTDVKWQDARRQRSQSLSIIVPARGEGRP
jgi:hypothetical protein